MPPPEQSAAEARPAMEHHYAEVAQAYDALAPVYDQAVGWSPQAARAKGIAMDEVLRRTQAGDRLLDIGSGVGTEAAMLARRGRKVHGIDLSPAMVAAAHAKAIPDCSFEVRRAADAGAAPGPFDGAYSFYGVLDLEPRLDDALRGVASQLPPHAPFVVGLLNPTASYELVLYPLLGRFKGIRKATKRPVRLKTRAGGLDEVSCRLRSPAAFARKAARWFDTESVRGLHFLLPPPRGPLLRMPRALRWAARVEDAVGDRWPWHRLGYFSLLTLRRRP